VAHLRSVARSPRTPRSQAPAPPQDSNLEDYNNFSMAYQTSQRTLDQCGASNSVSLCVPRPTLTRVIGCGGRRHPELYRPLRADRIYTGQVISEWQGVTGKVPPRARTHTHLPLPPATAPRPHTPNALVHRVCSYVVAVGGYAAYVDATA
jgi:hypothetical protein